MAFLFEAGLPRLEFLWRAAQLSAAMTHDLSFRRRARAGEAAAVGREQNRRESAVGPRPAEVMGEIVLLLAVHLAAVFAVVATVQALDPGSFG